MPLKKCPKCGYVRKKEEFAPDYECPSCGIVYTKYNSFLNKKVTFSVRMKKYTDQLKKRGYFQYLDATIHSDGRITKGDRTYILSHIQDEPFKIAIIKKGIFSSVHYIKLSKDRDVILQIVDDVQNSIEEAEKLRKYAKEIEKSETNIGYFLTNVIFMIAKIAKADGIVSKDEIKIISDFFYLDLEFNDNSYADAVKIFNYAKDIATPIEVYANNILKVNSSMLLNIHNLLFDIAASDGHISADEELMLNKVEIVFEISSKTKYHFFRQQQQHVHIDAKNRFAYILGISSDSTLPEVKSTYRKLAIKYHPDKVQHLGSEFQSFAEEKMKEINQAYDFFQKTLKNSN